MEPNNEKPMSGADVVVETLEARGTKYVFGVPGAKIDKVFDRLVDSTIQTVVCRHEQNAAFISGAIGRMTGKAGVAIVTSGPGVSNLVTGLATANSEGDPVVALGGAVAVADRLHQEDSFKEAGKARYHGRSARLYVAEAEVGRCRQDDGLDGALVGVVRDLHRADARVGHRQAKFIKGGRTVMRDANDAYGAGISQALELVDSLP